MADDLQNKPLKNSIPKIYKRHYLDVALFAWIRSAKTFVSTITTEQAIRAFYKDHDITEDEYPLTDCRTTYQRMTKEYYDAQKTDNSTKK